MLYPEMKRRATRPHSGSRAPGSTTFNATLLLYLTNGEKVETTKEHRFSVTGQGFVGAGRLAPGATLNTQSEQGIQVTGITHQEQSATVYNLAIENFHTYFVGSDSVCVHNVQIEEPVF